MRLHVCISESFLDLVFQVLVDNGAKEFKASQKTHELSALLTQLGVHSNGSGPYYPKAANAK